MSDNRYNIAKQIWIIFLLVLLVSIVPEQREVEPPRWKGKVSSRKSSQKEDKVRSKPSRLARIKRKIRRIKEVLSNLHYSDFIP